MPYAKQLPAAALIAVLPMSMAAASPQFARVAQDEVTAAAPLVETRVDRLIVKLRERHTLSDAAHSRQRRADAAAASAALVRSIVERVVEEQRISPNVNHAAAPREPRATPSVSHVREMSGSAHVVGLARPIDAVQASALAERLESEPEIEYAEPDHRLRAHVQPTDPLYPHQWGHGAGTAGANAVAAWDVTTGSANVVAAVVDSGYRMHPDLAANLLPGYDFISDPFSANDGDGRDADASDPGDWTTRDESLRCDGTLNWVTDSTWHGTHVAGTVGALANNGAGGVGVSWHGRIVPVRVLGKCGGLTSDMVDAIRWAAGLPVPGVPANPFPARVINVSFGTPGQCGPAMQSAVSDAIGRGASVVASAGNSDDEVGKPANCDGAIAVAALDGQGDKAKFSNYGSRIDIGAPGVQILSTANAGKTVPTEDNYLSYDGTSMAAPHVTGAIALMLAANPTLTPAEIRWRLVASARPYPAGSSCAATARGPVCGSGMLDARRAVDAESAEGANGLSGSE